MALTRDDVIEDEDGYTVFVDGHHDKEEFLHAVDEFDRMCGVIESDDDLMSNLGTEAVVHSWWRSMAPGSELMERCKAGDDNALPFTEISRP